MQPASAEAGRTRQLAGGRPPLPASPGSPWGLSFCDRSMVLGALWFALALSLNGVTFGRSAAANTAGIRNSLHPAARRASPVAPVARRGRPGGARATGSGTAPLCVTVRAGNLSADFERLTAVNAEGADCGIFGASGSPRRSCRGLQGATYYGCCGSANRGAPRGRGARRARAGSGRVAGERGATPNRGGASHDPRRGSAGTARAQGDQARVRSWCLLRVFRVAGRSGSGFLQHPGNRDRRPRGYEHRGIGLVRSPAPCPGGIYRARRRAMRILYPRTGDELRRSARQQSSPRP